jgi:exonuclease V gamma subunit
MQHLIANLEYSTESVLITSDKKNRPVLNRFAPFEAGARERLLELLHLYWRGLREPLRLFPKSSSAYAEKVTEGKEDEALAAAHRKWASAPKSWEPDWGDDAESKDAYFSLAFDVDHALEEDFEALARAVFIPPMEVMTE